VNARVQRRGCSILPTHHYAQAGFGLHARDLFVKQAVKAPMLFAHGKIQPVRAERALL
jgi:hypothetical protein